MNRPQATLQEIIGDRKIRLTRCKDQYNSRSKQSVGERHHTYVTQAYRFYDKIRRYNDQVGGV